MSLQLNEEANEQKHKLLLPDMKLLFLHLDDIKESGERLHEARVNHACIRICGLWAILFSLVCKTKIGLPASRESCEHQKQGVCAWLIVMNGPEDGVQVMTIPSCSHPGSCCKVESGISSIFIVLIFFLSYFIR